jgi:hypothetical protein
MSNLIYLALTAINLAFPFIFFLIYIYLTVEVLLSRPASLSLSLFLSLSPALQFAGFPYASPAATARLGSLTKLGMLSVSVSLSVTQRSNPIP